MAISRKQVEDVSLLARLLLSEAELDQMTGQLGKVLEYVALLREVDTEGVEPMAHPLDVVDAFRDDEVRPSLGRDQALANAPSRDAECYRVPAVLGEF
ncbi:MAG: Asp-tRNA(Asn)/Glu-tRNA(Gln) amidotransferase subunit GatC [Thermoguttaceae bacterium]|jgi:aspartyl-tRNA(Asn)/glutamyl-tRNA(Gln) amidotransferase subunit C|nr:Asp-tRNA(Asn)/Glu-tRNA(Gln) amidotransferase subunit GatC [Thermoguttaceae bacterium]